MHAVQQNSGFTLVELMITVVVIAILLTIGIPAFQSTLDKRRLIGAAEQLYADLQYARSEAVKRNTRVSVSFTGTGANWCYGMATTVACDCTAANSCQLDNIPMVVSSQGFRGVSLTPNFSGNDTHFDPRHGASDNGRATFSSDFGTIAIIVGNLGRVRICSTSPSLRQYKPSGTSC